MRIHLLIGPTPESSDRFRTILKKKSALLEKSAIMCPDWNHIRLYMACADEDAIGVVRFKRGFATALAQKALYDEIELQLKRAVEENKPDILVLANGQIGSMLHTKSELQRLKKLLNSVSDDIRITAHVDAQTRVLAPLYSSKVMEGRSRPLDVEFALAKSRKGWWKHALELREENQPYYGLFNDIQHPAPWLDYEAMLAAWEDVFGENTVFLRPLDRTRLLSEDAPSELNEILETDITLGKVEAGKPEGLHSAASVGRVRQFNDILIKYMQAKAFFTPRDLWRNMTSHLRQNGAPISAGSLFEISDKFAPANARLIKRFPTLKACLTPDAPLESWVEDDGGKGYRASQYLTAFAHQIRNNSTPVAELEAEAAKATEGSSHFDDLIANEHNGDQSKDARQKLLDKLKVNHQIVLSTHIRPHNDVGRVNEEDPGSPYSEVPIRELPDGNSGNVIVGCMKNEAPYIVEWIAYHRAMGVDNFVIYTNGCEDSTTDVLDRLQEMGIVQHRDNTDWRGNSPQQFALNSSLKEPVIQNAEWIIHIDVDEFINVRTGNGTLEDLFKATGKATNIAMTWRLFGHNGVTKLSNDFVIDQFDTCAPKYCPKPHTVWGFKSMFKNMQAYKKISCHRPNQIIDEKRDQVKWVNGSGKDVTEDYIKGGWRSSKKTVGYDLVQLNHYALRSAESFLIKRQRGRALHVDRSIGLNYWIRMDWCDFKDNTIKRNSERTRAEYERLMSDPALKKAHDDGLEWHKAKAEDLHSQPEFQELYAQALNVKLSETERVAYALALDMES
ncbi:glycosyltransferase family 2 protein [Lentibacter algarum]|uniref:glycosyltransferase family 2 protein n=1 Tax=Lentibacter algarum TaxID=576131 RepID=UPI001C09EE5D|nr:glycosyltransferase family 2 protein [Lentibacter algarum]MBU2982593.1 glycosyltransferase family 2 protein [Lentibacter algarum]